MKFGLIIAALFFQIATASEIGEKGPKIQTLIIFDHLKGITPDQLMGVKEIHLEGLLGAQVIPIKQPLHFAALNAFKKRIFFSCREKGYPSAKVELLGHNLKEGILKFVISEEARDGYARCLRADPAISLPWKAMSLLFEHYPLKNNSEASANNRSVV